MTYTYAVMGVSPDVYKEIKQKLVDAGYDHAIHTHGGEELLDMRGIALHLEVVKPLKEIGV